MLIRIGDKMVDVADRRCASAPCFWLGQDKGTFVQGRGYVRYHDKPRWVCIERHLRGCPRAGVCLSCRTVLAPYSPDRCMWCGSTDIEPTSPTVKGHDDEPVH